MSDELDNVDNVEDVTEQEEVSPEIPSELDTLKARADKMGIDYHHKIGVEKLKAKIEKALEPEQEAEEPEVVLNVSKKVTKVEAISPEQERRLKRANRKREANKLVRIRASCMNPAKREWEGEIISVGSSKLGTFKKYVPFDNEEGWHVPQIILWAMQERRCSVFKTTRGARGNKVRKAYQVREFNVEIMDPLTPKEMAALATEQRARNSSPQDER